MRSVAVCVLVVLSVFTLSQRAEAIYFEGVEAFGGAILFAGLVIITEPLIPDLHLEFGEGVEGVDLTLSWPLSLSFGVVGVTDRIALGLEVVVEPQCRPAGDALRLAFGGRLPVVLNPTSETAPSWFVGPGIVVEGGGILGDDGTGFYTGAGLIYGWAVAALGVNYRFLKPGDDLRHAVTVDLHIALPVFSFWEG